jgi:hypothetical protein
MSMPGKFVTDPSIPPKGPVSEEFNEVRAGLWTTKPRTSAFAMTKKAVLLNKQPTP